MWGAIKADLLDFVNTIQEDTTKTLEKVLGDGTDEEEDVSLQEKVIADLRRSYETYETPIKESDKKDFDKWRQKFNLSAYGGEIASVLDVEPEVSRYYAELVPIHLTPDDFWARLFFRIHQVRRGGGASLEDDDDEEELTWEDSDEDGGENDLTNVLMQTQTQYGTQSTAAVDGNSKSSIGASFNTSGNHTGQAAGVAAANDKYLQSKPAAEAETTSKGTTTQSVQTVQQPSKSVGVGESSASVRTSSTSTSTPTQHTSDASTATTAPAAQRAVSVMASPDTHASASQTDPAQCPSTTTASTATTETVTDDKGTQSGGGGDRVVEVNKHLQGRVQDLTEENSALKDQLALLTQRLAAMEAQKKAQAQAQRQAEREDEEQVGSPGSLLERSPREDASSDDTASGSAVFVDTAAGADTSDTGACGSDNLSASPVGSPAGSPARDGATSSHAIDGRVDGTEGGGVSDSASNLSNGDTEDWSRHSEQSGVIVGPADLPAPAALVPATATAGTTTITTGGTTTMPPTAPAHSADPQQLSPPPPSTAAASKNASFREETAKYLAALDDPDDEEEDGWS